MERSTVNGKKLSIFIKQKKAHSCNFPPFNPPTAPLKFSSIKSFLSIYANTERCLCHLSARFFLLHDLPSQSFRPLFPNSLLVRLNILFQQMSLAFFFFFDFFLLSLHNTSDIFTNDQVPLINHFIFLFFSANNSSLLHLIKNMKKTHTLTLSRNFPLFQLHIFISCF